jgi:NAD(P)H dehydrogenase (quinone)
MSESEYFREANYRNDLPIADDIRKEQEKINRCDALVFIYPIFWTEAPSKLVGWFDRVWTYGFAYGERTMKKLKKALFICIAGRSYDDLKQSGHLDAMKKVMLGDRIFDRVYESNMIIFDGMTRENSEQREHNRKKYLLIAFQEGYKLMMTNSNV